MPGSMFSVLKDPIRASRLVRGLDGLYRLAAQATPQEVGRAVDVSHTEVTSDD